VLRSLIKFLKRIHAEHLRRVRRLRVVVRPFCVAYSLTEKPIWQRVVRYIIVTWQAVIPPCFCAVSLLILYLSFTHAQPVRGILHLQQPFVPPRLTDSSPYYTYAGETTDVVSRNSSYAGKAVYSILVFYTVRPCLLFFLSDKPCHGVLYV
jgi:hypothetical protein